MGLQVSEACWVCYHPRARADENCGSCGLSFKRAEPNSHQSVVSLPAERRHLVVMFCDLVGSTQLASTIDPEEMLELMTTYQSTVLELSNRFGGYVARYHGDGILIYFGWPSADETSAENAVRTGLKVVEALGEISVAGETLQTRIGIASGLVVVGDVSSASDALEHAIVGEAPNIAARLQSFAKPGEVVIDISIRSRIGNLFDCHDLGEISIKGYDTPIKVWRADAETVVHDRFNALRSQRPIEIQGREREIDVITGQWRQAQSGNGQIAFISGEAGIGKSRLVATLGKLVGSDDSNLLSFFCAPHLKHTALHPISSHIENAAGIHGRDTADQMLQKIRALLSTFDHTDEDVALIAELLSIPVQNNATVDLSPDVRRRKAFEVVLRFFDELTTNKPTVVVFEDLHWADPTTLEFLGELIRQTPAKHVFLIGTFRTEFQSPWSDRENTTHIVVPPLNRNSAVALTTQLAGADTLPQNVIDEILRRAEGNPLFLEEVTKAVLENNDLSKKTLQSKFLHVDVPDSLQASLMARLDRLPLGKTLAQIGSVIGRDFGFGVLADVAELTVNQLNEGLEQLVNAELIYRRRNAPDSNYIFKHALVKEAAYDSLLLKRRKELHGRIVDVLLLRFPDAPDRQPALFGHHCAKAGRVREAAHYFRRAGELSAKRAAISETRYQLERGLALAASLPNNADRRGMEAELKLALGRVLLSTSGSADVDAGKILEEATELCRDQDDLALYTRAHWALWFNSAHRRELQTANAIARNLLSKAVKDDFPPALMVAHTMVGIANFWAGHFADAKSNLTKATEICQTNSNTQLDLAIVAGNLEHHVRMQLALSLRLMGHFEAADAQSNLAAERVRAAPHIPSRAIVIAAKCRCDWLMRDNERTRESAMELLELAEKQGLPFYLALGQCHLGWLAVMDGSIDEGLREMQDGYNALQSSDAEIWQPYLRGMLAEAVATDGDFKQASTLLDAAFDASKQTGGVWFDAELYRLRGCVEVKRNPSCVKIARDYLEKARSIACHQSAKLWELRACNSLAQLLETEGQYQTAHDIVAPIHSWFTDGRDAHDVKVATSILANLDDKIGSDGPQKPAPAAPRHASVRS